ncbi:uncharacterized protein LOC135162728 [Diachasmimorpha longicaudata]|uniref:uncharacterized protein LOC135162728 n=1 Tax=Diachasmimorpha longicaudata TaxID=58733 RepID=UPI0030B8CA48
MLRESEAVLFNWTTNTFTMTQASRKRGRSIEDESSEFTPLSKRINNLHINNLGKLCEVPAESPADAEWTNRNFVPSPNHSEPSQSSSSSDGFSLAAQNNFMIQEYQPDLSPTENPYYYENNKLLYSLYVERMHRRVSYDL